MRKFIHILMLLLSATAVLSCSKDMTPEDGLHSITVIGMATDIETNRPIKEIKLTMYALENKDNDNNLTVGTAYTDKDGKFVIIMSGFMNPTSFSIKAEDPKGVYEISTHEIPLVTWTSEYSISNGTLYVNGCDFHLTRATASESSPRS